MMRLEGQLEHITYQNQDNYYTVARLRTHPHNNMVTIVGNLGGIFPGESLELEGDWIRHPRYGQQFAVKSLTVSMPATVDGIRKCLHAGVIKGIGRKMADRLIDHFGPQTLDVIEASPHRLLEIEGIGQAKADMIFQTFCEHRMIRDLMIFLQNHQVKLSYSAPILKAYGEDAIDIIMSDPYRLTTDIPEIDFNVADQIARNLGIAYDQPQRVEAYIMYALNQEASRGHCYVPKSNLFEHCQKMMQTDMGNLDKALTSLIDSYQVIVEPDEKSSENVFLKHFHTAECGIKNRIQAQLSVPFTQVDIQTHQVIDHIQTRLAITLSDEQLDILHHIFSHKIAIVTGGPGTGKTTLIQSIRIGFEILRKRVILAAPTGRAARRISEIVQKEARTIHRLLGYNFKENFFYRNRENPLDADAIIIDEVSMVDLSLMYHLLEAITVNTTLILVGDVDQLPSVSPGNILADFIQSRAIPVFRLTRIFRQRDHSPIVVNAHKISKGDPPDLADFNPDTDIHEFYFIEQKDPQHIAQTILSLCSQDIPNRFGYDPIEQIQVLTPIHKGPLGTFNLNQMLQTALNPSPKIKDEFATGFKVGDKVMHLINNYDKDVFNGDVGIVKGYDEPTGLMTVDYYGRDVEYNYAEMNDLCLAYAMSVHKSQGSEYPVVVMPVVTQHYIMLQRNLLYTAITRAKNLVILIGTQKALSIAIANDKPEQRLSRLSYRLEEMIKEWPSSDSA